MTALDFVRAYLGTRITATGGLGGECVDLANQWVNECCGIGHVFRNAIDWADPAIPRLVWTRNTPTNAPRAGALAVWQATPSLGIGPNGHIALVLAADRMHLLTCDQNWPEGALCSLTLHSYAGVLGWQTVR